MQLSGIGLLIPEWLLGWLAVAAIGAAILGLRRRIVVGLAAPPAFHWLIAPLLRPWLAIQPIWLQALVVLTVGLLAAQSILRLVFGRQAAGVFVGILLVRLCDGAVSGAGRRMGGVVRRLLAPL